MNISNNVSALQSYATNINKNAVNIANANKNASINNKTDLLKEITSQIINGKSFDANSNTIKTVNQTLGNVLDMKT